MVAKSRLMYVTLYVHDLAVSRRFYEDVLGLRALDPDAASVSYRIGHVILSLHRAAEPAVLPGDRHDRSVTLTMLVDDVQALRAALEGRGAGLRSTQTSRAGAMVDFYDPDGHWFSLYEPSDAALSWPSAEKIRTLRRAAAPRATADDPPGLGDQELLYVFLYVQDLDTTREFYQDAVGLVPMEVNTCHRGLTSAPDGVVKYDAGGVLLTTHHVGDGDHAAWHKVSTGGSKGIAFGFHTTDLGLSTAEMSSRGLTFTKESVASRIGPTAAFTDPGGHQYYLCEPSVETMALPTGAAIRQVLSADL
jgi:catechol 2,3-dioxygenase-like lactoylglutathione lyase family enzyme